MSARQSYTYSTGLRVAGLLLNAVGSLLLLPFVLRSLGEHDFGFWVLATTITGYLLLLDLGVAAACTRYLCLQKERSAWFAPFSNSMLLSLGIAGVLLLAAGLIQGLLYWQWLDVAYQPISDILTLLLVEVAFSMPIRLYQSIMRAELRYLEVGIFEIARIVLRLSGITLILWWGGGLLPIIIYASVINLLFFVSMMVSIYRQDKTSYFRPELADRAQLWELFHFSKYIAVSQVADFFKYRTDNLLIGLMLGIGAVAPYGIMIVVVDMLVQILARFQAYWDTIIVRNVGLGQTEEALDVMLRSQQIALVLLSLASFNISLAGEKFLTLWVGEQYAYLALPLALFSLTLVSTIAQWSTTSYFNALGKQKENAWLAIMEIGLKLLLAIPFTYTYGFYGLITANALSGMVAVVLRVQMVAKVSGHAPLALLSSLYARIRPVIILLAVGWASFTLINGRIHPLLAQGVVLFVQAAGLLIWVKNPALGRQLRGFGVDPR